MKLSEAAKLAGLSKRTVHYYTNLGFVSTTSVCDGKKERPDYSQGDVDVLRAVAGLRRAMFSMEQVYLLAHDPSSIPAVMKEYRKSLKEQAPQPTALISAAEGIDSFSVTDILDLYSRLSGAADGLPLPRSDAKPGWFAKALPQEAPVDESDDGAYTETKFILPPTLHQNRAAFASGFTAANMGMRFGDDFTGKRKRRIVRGYANKAILVLIALVFIAAAVLWIYLVTHEV
jgi:DNA-binding transcriptional MerR regulator